jgi:hypothetical protein
MARALLISLQVKVLIIGGDGLRTPNSRKDSVTLRSDAAGAMRGNIDSSGGMKMMVNGFRRANTVLGRGPAKDIRRGGRNSGSSNNMVDSRGLKSGIENINFPIMGVRVPKVLSLSRDGIDVDREL